MIEEVPITELRPDPHNPRKADTARLHVLALSLSKLGFILPIHAQRNGIILSGHQRLDRSVALGYETVPVQYEDVPADKQRGINVLFNRATNDFGLADSGARSFEHLSEAVEALDELDDFLEVYDSWFVWGCEERSIANLSIDGADYSRKAVTIQENFMRMGIRIPIVLTSGGRIVNGKHRFFTARRAGVDRWPVIEIPDDYADLSLQILNFLSMDYDVDEEFAQLLRHSAFRRPHNARGNVPKAYRFWANGERTLSDRHSYSTSYWRTFRDMHGNCLDFGAGLCKVAPYLQEKGIECLEFEPYRIDKTQSKSIPSPQFSRRKAREFLQSISNPEMKFDSIFLASVLNSIPFPRDRMCVLAIVHALCGYETVVYGTCRDASDFTYDYQGLRQPNFFVFDAEPGVRLGDSLACPKAQKFHTQEEARAMFEKFWNRIDFWPGGNIFYFRLQNPKRMSPRILRQALEFEFSLPFRDGSTLNLVSEAVSAFEQRCGVTL
jgi:ParB-like chromosome segregation protein Spo0J